jgi:ElaA protein
MTTSATPPALSWTWARFADLSPFDVYDLLALRSEVFVVEQQCIFQDPDYVDQQCWHLLGRAMDAEGKLLAYLRLVDPGVKYPEPSIGRVISSPAVRGTGTGRVLVAEGIARHHATWPGQKNRIGAQARLERFYMDLGFRTISEPYIEDDIPHIEMILEAA